jgi:hypothetical protein
MRHWLLVVAFAAVGIADGRSASGQPYHQRRAPAVITAEHTQLLRTYERAVFDSAVYQAANLRSLRPLIPNEKGEVLVASLTSLDGKVGDLLPVADAGVWVTGVPEVQDICRGFTGDVVMQLRQLLGLPPDAHVPRMIVLRARVTDIFRPAVDPNVLTAAPCEKLSEAPTPSDCGNLYPSDTTQFHYTWMADQAFQLHQLPQGYPWTHLGYTYNWAPKADRYGASEYVIREGAPAVIVENVTPEAYCRPPAP